MAIHARMSMLHLVRHQTRRRALENAILITHIGSKRNRRKQRIADLTSLCKCFADIAKERYNKKTQYSKVYTEQEVGESRDRS